MMEASGEDTTKTPPENPYVFILGSPRSGTTLLRRILDAHSAIAITRETHWIPRYFQQRIGVTPDGLVTPDLISNLLEDKRFPKMGISREQLEELTGNGNPVKYNAFVTALFDLYGRSNGKRLAGDKTPGYVRSISLLHTLWPNARFVHLVRDGRDVCLSAREWRRAHKLAKRHPTWHENPVVTAALWWEWHVRLGREAGTSLRASQYHEIRYELLVTEPEKECASLCAFLEIPYEEAMVRFHEGRTKGDGCRDAKHAWMPITPGLRDWRKQMSGEDVERFEAASGDLLAELGYPRAVMHPARKALDEATSIRHLFSQNIRLEQRLLPNRW